MPKLTAAQKTELLELLLELPATKSAEQREALLFGLPPQITNSLDLSIDRYAALVKLVEALDFWGQLTDGRWAMEVMLRNAQRAARNTQFDQKLEVIRQVFDLPAAKADLPALPEQITSDISYLMPVGFLEAGYRAARAVGRVCVPQVFDGVPRMNGDRPSLAVGTGWLIAPRLLVTNHHVIAARLFGDPPPKAADVVTQATSAEVWFDYVDALKPYVAYNVTALEASDQTLDYAVLRVAEASKGEARPIAEWGCLQLAPETAELRQGQALNIIQHPTGDVKHVAIRRNEFIGAAEGSEFLYLTDTLPGSSGSPVFDDDWQVVGLHRASRRLPEKVYLKGEMIKYNNVGIRIHDILRHLPSALRGEIASEQTRWAQREGHLA
jgi:V8-like Glu-specific endopeptidase